jgi:nucleolar protein 4
MMEKRDRRGVVGVVGGQRRQQQKQQKQQRAVRPERGVVNDGKDKNNKNGDDDDVPNKVGHKKVADPRTLFVKFHPPSASITRQHLSDHFSNYGPVNRCSVIRNSKSRSTITTHHDENDDNDVNDGAIGKEDRGSRGFGFVRFVNEDDARNAAEAIRAKNSRSGGRGGGEVMVVDGVSHVIHAERAADASSSTTTSTSLAGSAPHRTKRGVEDSTSRRVGPGASSSVEVVAGDDGRVKRTDNKDVDADAAYRAESKRKRTSRVIIRNLSFHATERHVRTAMENTFGPVSSIDLPSVPGTTTTRTPRHRGFAFVTFANASDARKAVSSGGEDDGDGAEVKIKNRPVAIDFSISKMEHRRIAREGGGEENGNEEEKETKIIADEDENEDDKDGGSEGDDSDSKGDDDDDDEDDGERTDQAKDVDDGPASPPSREYDPTESRRTLFLRNVPFDATRHDVYELFRRFGRVEAAYLVKERDTGVFRGTAFVRFEAEKACMSAMKASGGGIGGGDDEGAEGGVVDGAQQFVSGKNIAMGLGADGVGGAGDPSSGMGLTLRGRTILVDLAVDRTTASSLAVRRDDDGKPIKKMVGKDRRNLYLKNEGRVMSSAESGDAREASAKHGGMWEDLPPGDRAKRERAFADKSTKLRSPLFFINPHRISIRNLAKHVDEAALKRLVFGALKTGLKEGLVTPKDAVAHWRAGGELAHSEVMRRATDPNLVTPPLDEKNMRGSVTSVFIDRDVSGGKKAADAPSRGFGFVEFAHHTHALAVLRQLNNNPAYSAECTAGGKHASEMAKQKRGKKGKRAKVDPETGLEFVNEDGKASVPRLIVEFAVSYLFRSVLRTVALLSFFQLHF